MTFSDLALLFRKPDIPKVHYWSQGHRKFSPPQCRLQITFICTCFLNSYCIFVSYSAASVK